MRVTVFGASGKVGSLVVQEALARGHEVVAFTHSKDLSPAAGLRVVKGDIYDAESATGAIKGSDAVISALGSWGTPKKDVLSAAIANIIPAMEKAGIKRIVSLTGSGANAPDDKFDPINAVGHMAFGLVASKVLHDSEKHIEMLAESSLDWTVLRSPPMNSRGNPRTYSVGQKRPLPIVTINRRAVAKCLVDLVESTRYARQAPFIKR